MRHLNWFYRSFIAGKSTDEDTRRHEMILNAILCGTSVTSIVSTITSFFFYCLGLHNFPGVTLRDSTALMILSVAVWAMALRGRRGFAMAAFLFAIFLEATQLSLNWSFELATVQLLVAMFIVIVSMILRTRLALVVSSSIIATMFLIGAVQVITGVHVDTAVVNKHLALTDDLDYSMLLVMICFVSYLSNRETTDALFRERRARAELAKERDSLEVKVIERTKKLEDLQLERTLELQRFAEFGRLTAHLLHDLSNPLTAASLHLQLANEQKSKAYRQVKQNIEQIERYVTAARKQLQTGSVKCKFKANTEINQLCDIVKPLAETASVALELRLDDTSELHGDPVKFHQIVSNLVMNAIDACADNSPEKPGVVSIHTRSTKNQLEVVIQDNGVGISQIDIPKLFEPFYSTKLSSGRGLGIGLSMVKSTVEDDFNAQIVVRSTPGKGTGFTVLFPQVRRKTPSQKNTNSTAALQSIEDLKARRRALTARGPLTV